MNYKISYRIQLVNGDIMTEQHGTMLSDHEMTEEEFRAMKWEGKIYKLNFSITKIEVE